MNRNSIIKTIVGAGGLIGLGGSISWLIYDFGFEPFLGLITAIIAVVITYYDIKSYKIIDYGILPYRDLKKTAKDRGIKYKGLKQKKLIKIIKSEEKSSNEIYAKKYKIYLFITVIVAAIIGFYLRPKKEIKRYIDITSGEVCSYLAAAQTINFRVGGANVTMPKSRLERLGFDYNDAIDMGCRSYMPLKVNIQNDKLVVSTQVRSWNGKEVAKVVNNAWESESQSYFKLNSDDCAFEIVDKNLFPLLQIEFKEIGSAFVSGIYYCKDKVMFLNAHEGYMESDRFDDFTSRKFKQYYMEEGSKIERLFSYTGKNWYGKRRE